MTTTDILLIGVALSMDAVAISMTNGMVYTNLGKSKYMMMILFFGAFQGIMPLLGYVAGGFFEDIITKHAGIIVLLILGILGIKMLKEGIERSRNHEQVPRVKTLAAVVIGTQAVATSIDAFAVGVGFSAIQVNIWYAVSLIAATTACLVGLAIIIGRKFGDLLGSGAEIFGGVVLIVIGIKAIL